MMRALLIAVLALPAMGCTTPDAAEPPIPHHDGHMGQECDAEAARSLVGQAATSQIGADALRLTGARTLRWLRPGQVVTMEYRADRLNIMLDAGNGIVSINCG